MPRPLDQHISLAELRLLSSQAGSADPGAPSSPDQAELEQHLLTCSLCRELLEEERLLFRLAKSAPGKAPVVATECPSEEQWKEFAAGQQTNASTGEYLEHAMYCLRCTALLNGVSEQFANEVSPEEAQTIANLKTATPEAQRQLARRLWLLAPKNPAPASTTSWWQIPSAQLQLAAAFSTLLLIAIGAWWYLTARPSDRVNHLLAQAYSERRTMPLRIAGATYAPVEAFRGEQSPLRRPTPLLEAELLIAKHLSAKPDDPLWLDARGKADLLDGNYSAALSALESAHRSAPANSEISVDLSSAYFIRAEFLKRPDDYGQSVELLSKVLTANPNDAIALFNRAISSERVFLYQQAILDWQRYLQLDPQSPWAEEARKRLALLQDKVSLQKNLSLTPPLSAADFLQKIRSPEFGAAFDPRIERQLDLALTDWIPQAFPSDSSITENSKLHLRASQALAELLISRHSDYWFSDFLAALDHNPNSRAALPAFHTIVKPDQASDVARTRKAAAAAATIFRNSGNPAGEALALFEESFADQLAHEVASCYRESRAANTPTVSARYPWLSTQFLLESAICTELTDETARQLTSQALVQAQTHHFPSLALRATTFVAGLYQYMGDSASAWKYSEEGLAQYWNGDYPPMRGYSLYAQLCEEAEDAQQWFLDALVLQEGMGLIPDDPDVQMLAFAQQQLSNAQSMTGDFPDAERNLLEAHALFVQSASGVRKRNFDFESQVGLAKLDLLRSNPAKTIDRLESLQGQLDQIADKDLTFEYFKNLGLAYASTGDSSHARKNLQLAVSLVEQSLLANHNERERLIWCRKSDQVYRALIRLDLAAAPRDVFAQWEWFKGASLRGKSASLSAPLKNKDPASFLVPASFPAVPAGTLLISYAVFPDATFVWSYDGHEVRQDRLPISARDLDLLARKFAGHCSHPDSDIATITTESRLLYEKLIQPLEPRLGGYQHLLIEPDQSLWLVPFELLLDPHQNYLGDRYAISFSPGLNYLGLSAPWRNISRSTRILVAGDPDTQSYLPLDDAEQEAKGIARHFRFTHLLLKKDANDAHIADEVRGADIFHFSGHAAASPDGFGLLLGGTAVVDAARLRVSGFSRLQLAVLSACDTANGTEAVFDDRDSLARLLVGAGVPEVVASRWMVDSRATAVLMNEFYTELLSGQTVSSALHGATRKLRSQPEFAHPFYWGAFSAFGRS